jgi:formamidopyrimidine-DNA glycosylase
VAIDSLFVWWFVKVMPELPEITVISRQMNKEIKGKRIANIEAKQPKNLNMPAQEFVKIAKGETVSSVSSKGKWIFNSESRQ